MEDLKQHLSADLALTRHEVATALLVSPAIVGVYLAVDALMALTLMQQDVPRTYALLWAAVFAAYLAARTLLTRVWQRSSEQERDARASFWRHATLASVAALGLIWGVLGALGMAHASPFMQLFWTAMTLVACLLAATVLFRRLFHPLLLLALAPLVPAWWYWGGTHTAAVLAGIASSTAVSLLLARRRERLHVEQTQLRLRNEALTRILAQKNSELERANRSKTALLAIASHDLRQPVQALGLLIELMKDDDERTLRSRLDMVSTTVNSLADMLSQLLDFNRLDLGLYEIRPRAVSLQRLLGDVRATFTVAANRKGLALEVETQAAWVESDPRLLRRIISNLVTNAIRYTHAGHIRVACAVQDGTVSVSVADTGIGIEPERLETIFDEYVRSVGERAEWEEGLGLGLSIARKGIELLGHHISVTSALGVGTTFTLALGPALPADTRRELDTPSPAALPGLPIAVVDNDAAVIEGLAETVRRWGARPFSGRNLEEVQAALAEAGVRPALAISDLHLSSSSDGMQVIAALRASFPGAPLPAVLLTGDLDPAIEKQAGQQGIRMAYKPLHPSRLRDVVTAALKVETLP